MSDWTIETVAFGPDGVRLAYMSPTDVRAEGEVYQAHTIAISWGTSSDELADLITALEDAANALLQGAIQQWARTAPVDLTAERQAALDANDTDEGLGA